MKDDRDRTLLHLAITEERMTKDEDGTLPGPFYNKSLPATSFDHVWRGCSEDGLTKAEVATC